MAGVSLKCGDCGTLMKSVEEAQEHAELTSHTNFAESTEAVLNLVCSTCGKPCRSKTVRIYELCNFVLFLISWDNWYVIIDRWRCHIVWFMCIRRVICTPRGLVILNFRTRLRRRRSRLHWRFPRSRVAMMWICRMLVLPVNQKVSIIKCLLVLFLILPCADCQFT